MYPNSNVAIQLKYDQATMAVNNQYEVVNGAKNLQREGDSHVRLLKSYWGVKSPPEGSLPRHTPKTLLTVNIDSTEVSFQEHLYEVDRMVTEEEFKWWLLSQC